MICIRDCSFVSLAFQTVLLTAALANANFLNRAFMGAGSRQGLRGIPFFCALLQMPREAEEPVIFASFRLGQVWLGAKVQN